MLETFSVDTFKPLLQNRFLVPAAPNAPIELELIEVEDSSTSSQERFCLLLRGPLDSFLPQAMYPFTHQGLGTFDLFIAPLQKEPGGFVYQATFNRFRGEAGR